MKVIVLAAGEGTRLRPLTNEVPKCMVKVNGKPILEHQLEVFKSLSLNNVVVIKGYKQEAINYDGLRYYVNEKFNVTNMVYSLFLAQKEFDEDIIISYGDIIYKKEILMNLIKSDHQFTIAIDVDWLKFWSNRMEDVFEDAETLIRNEEGFVVELGNKTRDINNIQAQYMGLILIKKEALKTISSFYHNMDKNRLYRGKNLENIFFTTFIQELIDAKIIKVGVSETKGGWIEIDTPSDINLFRSRL